MNQRSAHHFHASTHTSAKQMKSTRYQLTNFDRMKWVDRKMQSICRNRVTNAETSAGDFRFEANFSLSDFIYSKKSDNEKLRNKIKICCFDR